MTTFRPARVVALMVCAALWLMAAPGEASGQKGQKPKPAQQQRPYQPEIGQEGKDVVWVPTAETLVDEMLDLAAVTRDDYLIDLGSGDGRTVIAAAKRGARAHGIEYNPDMVALAKRNADDAGVAGVATFERADLFEADLSKATVVTMFLLPSINLKLRPALLALKPGTRIVSNTFPMGDWEPDASFRVTRECVNYCTALLWVVPAKVQGTWALSRGRLLLSQAFQKVSGSVASWGATTPITAGRLQGDHLSFSVRGSDYFVVVKGDVMEGTVVTGRKKEPFKATRAPRPRPDAVRLSPPFLKPAAAAAPGPAR